MDSLLVQQWVPVLTEEYLRSFIKDGGAAVKFAVGNHETREGLLASLKATSEKEGYSFASLDAATTKIHMVDKVFHAVANDVDWDKIAEAFLRSAIGQKHALAEGSIDLNILAAHNGLDPIHMRKSVNEILRDRLLRDYSMTQEFRIAMLHLCQEQLESSQTVPIPIKEWLRGDLKLISALKRAPIFQRIGRHNGRHMLHSLAHWLHLAGKSGLVLTLDISRLLEQQRPADRNGGLHYSKAAVLDAYEVIRQFVDATDELHYGLIVIIGPENAVLSDEARGFTSYNALWLRIADEVKDRRQPNP